jgi:hypothetical protein
MSPVILVQWIVGLFMQLLLDCEHVSSHFSSMDWLVQLACEQCLHIFQSNVLSVCSVGCLIVSMTPAIIFSSVDWSVQLAAWL